MDVGAYLERINYRGSTVPNAETLQKLQEAHLLAVPFENLSIYLEEPVVLDDKALFDKVVNRRRGGFCYELNGLFSALLRGLGFDVVKLAGSVARGGGAYSPDFAHMSLMVTLEERWLVEVGFGETFRRPLRIDDPGEQKEAGALFKIVPGDRFYTLMRSRLGGEWQPQYRFRLSPYEYADFAEMCYFQQYSPESHFRQGRVCSLATPDGRITLSEVDLTRTWLDGRREEQSIESEAAFNMVLQEQFGIYVQGEWRL